MTGLFGYLHPDQLQTAHITDEMADILSYCEGVHKQCLSLSDGCVGLTFLLPTLTGPIIADGEDSQLKVLLDGYLTNTADLQRDAGRPDLSGARLIAFLFAKEREALFAKLEGTFSLFISDPERRLNYIVSDAFATRPLYYSQTTNGLAFGPELKVFLACTDMSRPVDWAAVGDFLVMGNIWGTKTFLSNVSILELAHYLRWSPDNGLVKRKYWEISMYPSRPDFRFEEWADFLHQALLQICKPVQDLPGRKALMLSGGFDSRHLACYLCAGGVEFTGLQVQYEQENNPDQVLSSQIADRLGVQTLSWGYDLHHPEDLLAAHLELTDGLLPSTMLVTALPLERMRERFEILMNGQPGNLIFGDLATTFEQKKYRVFERGIQFEKWRNMGPEGLDAIVCRELFQRSKPSQVTRIMIPEISKKLIGYADSSFEEAFSQRSDIFGAKKFDFLFFYNYCSRRMYFPDWVWQNYFHIVKPYYSNKNFIELCFQVPQEWKFSRAWDTRNLIVHFPEIADIPKVGSWPSIFRYPDVWQYQDIYRTGEVIRTHLCNAFEEYIYSTSMQRRFFLNADALRMAWERHKAGLEDNSFILGCLISLDAFFRKFID